MKYQNIKSGKLNFSKNLSNALRVYSWTFAKKTAKIVFRLFMKKLLGIVVLGLLLSGNAYAVDDVYGSINSLNKTGLCFKLLDNNYLKDNNLPLVENGLIFTPSFSILSKPFSDESLFMNLVIGINNSKSNKNNFKG